MTCALFVEKNYKKIIELKNIVNSFKSLTGKDFSPHPPKLATALHFSILT